MHRPILLAIALLYSADGAPAQVGPADDNRIANGDAEDGARQPDDWGRGAPVPGVEYQWDRQGGFAGGAALSLSKTVERYFPIAEWHQDIEHKGTAQRIHVGALIRAEHAYKATLDVMFTDAAGETVHRWAAYIGARASGDPPADHDWLWYSGVAAIPPDTIRITIGLQIYGPGHVWFDRVLARYVADDTPETDAAALSGQPAEHHGELPVMTQATPPAPASSAETDGPRPADLRVGDNPRKRYFLNGPQAGQKGPFKLLVVLPGGDGSADFQAFVTRIATQAATDRMIVAQAVAPVWSPSEDRIVWPTETSPDAAMEFSTETFVIDIIDDIRKTHRIDKKHIYTLGWSSGGPPCYALSLRPKTPVRGSLIAMSVFQPDRLPALGAAKGQAYFLLHSPQDFIAMSHPEAAQKELAKRGAKVKLVTYEGGHGWHGDVYGNLRAGLEWLERESK